MQFMPATARGYGLRVENEIDDRLDPVKSIDAAGRLLRDSIRQSKGDIYQALIMYNWGSGNWVKWKSGEKPMMPEETRRYLGRYREAMKQTHGMSDTSVAR
jgi:membrane-bound lytic murein transglycosylase D